MKKYLLFILLFAVSATALAELRWLNKEYDFGVIDEDMGKVTGQIRFVNESDSDVVIRSVRVTCGCTASSYPRRPIASGDTAVIEITYNPYGRPGKFSKESYVITNTVPRRTKITVRGNVVGEEYTVRKLYPVSVGDLKMKSMIANLGEMKKHSTRISTLKAYNQNHDSLRITFENVPKHISIIPVPEIVPPADVTAFTIYYNASRKNDWGSVSDSFDIVATSVKTGEQFRGKAEAIAYIVEDFGKLTKEQLRDAPRLSINNSKIDCGVLDRQSTKKKKYMFELQNCGKDPLKIRKIYCSNKKISINPVNGIVKKGGKVKVSVTLVPNLQNGDVLNEKIMIITNDPSHSQAFVRIVGEIK